VSCHLPGTVGPDGELEGILLATICASLLAAPLSLESILIVSFWLLCSPCRERILLRRRGKQSERSTSV
jgi:hypothetical protein